MIYNSVFLTAMILVCTGSLSAQRLPPVQSPEIHADNSITFRLRAPAAKMVLLQGEFLTRSESMQKDTGGVWSFTTAPVKPDIYPYSFLVDSIGIADPANASVFANERFKRSIVDVPGDKQSLIHSLRNVPHGKVSYRLYESAVLGRTRQLLVYTPPGFDAAGQKKYPVLYLIHGGSDTEETWTKVGKANLIADNMIAEKRAEPMIIVMPYGNVRPSAMDDFTKEVVTDIIPFIESNYPVLRDSKSRAVAGFSVGGGQTLNIGLTNTDKFGSVCSYAPYTATDEFRKNFGNWNPDTAQLNKNLRLFTISVGTEDFLYESVKQNIAMLKEKNIRVDTLIVPGGHTWMNCRLFLGKSLEKLFR